jgi:hypothetical protein
VLKLLWAAAALGVAIASAPAGSDPPATAAVKKAPPPTPFSQALPVAALLSGVMLVAIANRRRNLQRVLC